MSTQWEYLVDSTTIALSEMMRECEALGAEGWELVSAFVVQETPGLERTRLIFKRRKEA